MGLYFLELIMREEIKNVLKEMVRRNYVMRHDNVIMSRKAFEVLPFVEWCYNEFDKGTFDLKTLEHCLMIANKVLNDDLIMHWKSGVPHFRDPVIMKRLNPKEKE
jgi:hypothetical protein